MLQARQRGFTLIELLVTMSIVVITMTLGVGFVSELMATNARATTVNTLVGLMTYARSEAIKRNAEVTVCATNDGSTCANAHNWSSGYMAFPTDVGVNASNPALRYVKIDRSYGISILNTDPGESLADGGKLKFSGDGSANGMTLMVCPDSDVINDVPARGVVVSTVGRVITSSGDRCVCPGQASTSGCKEEESDDG